MTNAEMLRAACEADPLDMTVVQALADEMYTLTGQCPSVALSKSDTKRMALAVEIITGTGVRPTRARQRIRDQAVNSSPRLPIVVFVGESSPQSRGEQGYFATPEATRAMYPNAYRAVYKGCVYVHSTAHLEVGCDWILRNVEMLTRK